MTFTSDLAMVHFTVQRAIVLSLTETLLEAGCLSKEHVLSLALRLERHAQLDAPVSAEAEAALGLQRGMIAEALRLYARPGTAID